MISLLVGSQPIQYAKIFSDHFGSSLAKVIVLFSIVGFLELFGILMVLPLLESLMGGSGSGEHGLGFLYELIPNMQLKDAALILLVAFFGKGLLIYFSLNYLGRLKAGALERTRSRLMDLYFSSRSRPTDESEIAKFTNILTTQSTGLVVAMTTYCRFLQASIILVILSTAAIFVLDAVVLAVACSALLIKRIFNFVNSRAKAHSTKLSTENTEFTDAVIESLSGYLYLKATNQYNKVRPRLNSIVSRVSNTSYRIEQLLAITAGAKEPVFVLLISSVLVLQIALNGMEASSVLAISVLYYRLISAAYEVQYSWQSFLNCVGPVELVNKEIALADAGSLVLPNSSDPIAPESDPLTSKDSNKEYPFFSLENVSFSYNSTFEVVKDFSFVFPKKGRFLIVGPSGSGKSTLLKLMLGLNSPQKGCVYFRHHKLSPKNFDEFRAVVGYVTQAPYIFKGSLIQNICLDFDSEPKPSTWIQAAVRDLNLEHLTDADIRGKISGGEAQRVHYLRELYRKPKILFLDEPDSSLDSESRNLMGEFTQKFAQSALVIEISHNEERECDNLIKLQATSR